MLGAEPDNQFTAVIYSQLGGPAVSTSPLYRLIKNVARSLYVARVSTALLRLKYHAKGTLFYLTTVASHHPSAHLIYKTSACNKTMCLLDLMCVSEPKEDVSDTFSMAFKT